jgi:hypothetical protein
MKIGGFDHRVRNRDAHEDGLSTIVKGNNCVVAAATAPFWRSLASSDGFEMATNVPFPSSVATSLEKSR